MLRKQLLEAYRECKEANWDGYGAKPINEDCVNLALRFSRLWNLGVPLPEVQVEPDGEVCLYWEEPLTMLTFGIEGVSLVTKDEDQPYVFRSNIDAEKERYKIFDIVRR